MKRNLYGNRLVGMMNVWENIIVNMALLDSIPDLPPCDSEIWGAGNVIDKIQRAHIFKDGKTFVDLKLLQTEELIVEEFKNLPPNPSRGILMGFVRDNFSLEQDHEIDVWVPPDWTPHPKYLDDITDKGLLHVGAEINKLWKVLSRKCGKELKDEPKRFSMIWVPNGFVMPGVRFRETYYWDTYWIIWGLLLSEMHETVKGMLENFTYLIERFGHVPNGTRQYYTRRSQPPFLVCMVSKYLECTTGDTQFLKDHIGQLDKELQFFMDNRSCTYKYNGAEYLVFHYGADCKGPRPESYAVDVEMAEHFHSESEKEEFYLHVKAASESGWDFSSRWFMEYTNSCGLCSLKTCYIAPVDLNALMYKNYMHMVDFYKTLNNLHMVNFYLEKAHETLKTITNLLWDPEENMWFDWNMRFHKRRSKFYASNLFPLWAEAYPTELKDTIGKCASYYLLRTGAMNHKGGIPASFQHTGEQWDFNVWPPLQQIIVSGLNKTKNKYAQKIAFRIARSYAINTISACSKGSGCQIFEKYNPSKADTAGGGGEYEVQTGFAWTNGVLLDFICYYGDDLLNKEEYDPTPVAEVYGSNAKQRYSNTPTPSSPE